MGKTEKHEKQYDLLQYDLLIIYFHSIFKNNQRLRFSNKKVPQSTMVPQNNLWFGWSFLKASRCVRHYKDTYGVDILLLLLLLLLYHRSSPYQLGNILSLKSFVPGHGPEAAWSSQWRFTWLYFKYIAWQCHLDHIGTTEENTTIKIYDNYHHNLYLTITKEPAIKKN